ncbi:MAG: NAD(P)-dependent alcohol dehydrogenase [Litorimonas sp.]
MKVACLRGEGLDSIVIEDRAVPEPGPGEVRVRVRACSLNYHDLAVVMGMIPTDAGRVLLSDGAGEIEAVGEGVTRWAVGDRVMSLFFPNWQSGTPELPSLLGVPGDHEDGFAADAVCVPENGLTRMPDGLDYVQAATLPCAALTAWRALFVERTTRPGDTVLVQGSGGVSLFALQLARAAGATVIATSSSDEKRERLEALGAAHTLNYRDTPAWGAAVRELTGGRGVDAVVEIGGPGTLSESITACRIGADIALIGVLTGVSGEVPTARLFQSNITLSGITVGSAEHQDALVRAVETNGLQPEISDRFALGDLAAAFAHQAGGRHFGKIVVEL